MWFHTKKIRRQVLFRTRFVGCYALPCISIKLWRSTCKPYACLMGVAVIFSNNRSTRLFVKPFELKCTTLLKLSATGILPCKLVHSIKRSNLEGQASSQVSQEDLLIRKLLVLDVLTQKDVYNLWKHDNMTEKLVQLGTELRWWW